jgi:hypothetical protein
MQIDCHYTGGKEKLFWRWHERWCWTNFKRRVDSVQGLKEYRIPPQHSYGKSADFTSRQVLTDSEKNGLPTWWPAPYHRAPPQFQSARLTCCFRGPSLGGGWGDLVPMLTWCCPINGVKHAGWTSNGLRYKICSKSVSCSRVMRWHSIKEAWLII